MDARFARLTDSVRSQSGQPFDFTSYLYDHPLLTTVGLVVPCLYLLCGYLQARPQHKKYNTGLSDRIGLDALTTDPGLLRKHSVTKSYHITSTGFTYPSIRTFYRPHPQVDKLPTKPTPLPLLVFIHGLGGSVAQFHPLLTSLVNVAPCLAVDLPGCGLSSFAPEQWDAYSTNSLMRLLETVIEQHRDKEHGQGVVLICHSMGCSLGALLASPKIEHYARFDAINVLGLVAICPVAEPPSASQVSMFRKLLYIPGPIFDLWRAWDRRGGADSVSVARFVGENADLTTREMQVRFNSHSRTPVWRRMAWGTLPEWSSGVALGGLPGAEVWSTLNIPLYLVAGASDHITPPIGLAKIARFLDKDTVAADVESKLNLSAQTDPQVAAHHSNFAPEKLVAPSGDGTSNKPDNLAQSRLVETGMDVQTTIFPAPTSHAVLYHTRTARTLSGYIQHFLASSIDHRLSLGWQLRHLCTEGKWDVKNLEKWRGVDAVSAPVAGLFRAMKTLREVDESHTPKEFVKDWTVGSGKGRNGKGAIAVVIDISHESPVYDPRGLEDGGIAYRKFPTVSKLPPTLDEVKHFIDLVDATRQELNIAEGPASGEIKNQTVDKDSACIAVHCHYGFNRTGFFIICYMVERMNWRLEDAIAEFAEARPPGVKRSHFVDELWTRYCGSST